MGAPPCYADGASFILYPSQIPVLDRTVLRLTGRHCCLHWRKPVIYTTLDGNIKQGNTRVVRPGRLQTERMNRMKYFILCAGLLLSGLFAKAQEQSAESKFISVPGARIQYLDFGGEGVPLIFIHAEGWDASTYKDFGGKFNGTNRVLSVTRPGYGESTSTESPYSIPVQAEYLIGFLDAMNIERAVFAGNSSPTAIITYLAEHYPGRVAGAIYLAGLFPVWYGDEREADPYGAGEMERKASTTEAVPKEKYRMLDTYQPEFEKGDRPPMDIPALAFASRTGLIGYAHVNMSLLRVGSPLYSEWYEGLPDMPISEQIRRTHDDPDFRTALIEKIGNKEARRYFLELAEDKAAQQQLYTYQQEHIAPMIIEVQRKFNNAFSPDMIRIVKLDVNGVFGYEYMYTPDLIVPHIREFLHRVNLREAN